jgi:hypothetical protein
MKYNVETTELIDKGKELQENKIINRNPAASLDINTALAQVKT